ncbi:transglutaminase family protein [Novosphingobium sp. Gsoil 351]|uniref:transglutaminase-like domain-containing protein n=1 Tax=Novosphingobium sp. Gsoil 351 TaxID=2675225 RepID=UPI0012B4C5F2|nr:transglutaminase family protein [Novosphingobium sp. Gsoil 351]QGN56507.1 transglutaminase family protein [Novosphingobium sp. Gsoil 351]
MLISCGYTIAFSAERATPMIALLSIRPERRRDLRCPHRISLAPDVPRFDFVDGFGNVCTRLTVPAGGIELSCDFVVEDSGKPEPVTLDANEHPIERLPDEVLPFLLPSRYCESDLLGKTAWDLFGHIEPGWTRVQEIVDFTHGRIAFGYEDANRYRTAMGAFDQRVGVCRDYAHLAIALCRAMNIPARYCTGYLGDIGIAPVDLPMDFSAWIEVWLGDRWHTFDPRHNRRRIGRVLMAVGRDAADAALTTAFGPVALRNFEVRCEETVSARARVAA